MYDPKTYWIEEGLKDNPIMRKAHNAQIEPLLNVLDDLTFNTVIELGAGWGRITKVLKEAYNINRYLAIDLSEARLSQIGADTKVADITTYRNDERYDLVLAVELLLHIKPDDLPTVISNMKSMSNKYVVTLDYDPISTIPLEEHNFKHDYNQYGNVKTVRISDKQSIHIWEVSNEV